GLAMDSKVSPSMTGNDINWFTGFPPAEPALDVLWRAQNSLGPLIQVMPADLWVAGPPLAICRVVVRTNQLDSISGSGDDNSLVLDHCSISFALSMNQTGNALTITAGKSAISG